jgi:hypothetical protein
VVLVVAATALIALALVKSDEWGLTSGLTAATAVTGAVLLAVFVVHQRRTTRPAIELSLFSVRNYAWGNVATLLFGIAFTAMFLSSILFLTNVWGYSVLRAGLAVAPGPALVAVLAPRMGKLAGTIGQRPLLVVGGVIYAVAGVWRLVALGAEPDYLVDYLPSMLFSGLGVALCFPQLSSVIGQALPQNRLGVGGAANQAIRQIGGTFGVALTIAFVTGATSLDDALRRFDRVWWLLIVGGIATALAALPLRTRQVASAAPSAVVEAVA